MLRAGLRHCRVRVTSFFAGDDRGRIPVYRDLQRAGRRGHLCLFPEKFDERAGEPGGYGGRIAGDGEPGLWGPNQGAYKLASTFPPGYTQAGTFVSAQVCPVSFAGRIVTGTVNAGLAPFATSGTFTMTFATNGNAYTITGGAGNSSGTYTLLLMNRSTMAVSLTDTRTATNTMYLSFGTAVSGLFAIAQATTTNGYEVGTFTANLVDTNPPVVLITSPVAGQGFSKPLATVLGTSGDNWGVAMYCAR